MRKLTGLLFLVMLSLLISSVVFANLSGFAGIWVNTDPNTRGVTKLSIEVSGNNVMLQAWGKCHPTDCDWGKVQAYPYTASVETNQASSDALSAVFTTGFSQAIMIVKQSGNQLKVEVFDRFTDNSGRSNYHNTYTFNRQLFIPIGPIRTIMPIGLATPQQTSPPNGSVFGHFPRTTTLKWNAVAGAASYTVEVDCFHCCKSGFWCTDVGQQWKVVPGLTTTYYTFDFVGAQPGRWRVWAVGSGGQQSAKSGWWEFKYTQ